MIFQGDWRFNDSDILDTHDAPSRSSEVRSYIYFDQLKFDDAAVSVNQSSLDFTGLILILKAGMSNLLSLCSGKLYKRRLCFPKISLVQPGTRRNKVFY